MDLSLWDPPVYEDDSADFRGDWQSDFSFGLGRDVIEEDAINERCCIEVLKRQISKADDEIKELEEEIIFLQAQVALEDDAWAKICFDTLTDRMKALDISIQRLKNEKVQQQQGQGSSSQTHGDPAQNEKQQTENEQNFCFQTDGDPAQNKKQQTEDEMDVCFQTDGDPANIESLQTEDDQDSHIRTCKDPSQNQNLQLEHEMGVQTHAEPAQIENLQAEHELDFDFQTSRDPAQDETLQVEDDMGVPCHKHGEPAPRLSEILKALLEKYYFPNKDKQSSSFNADKLATLQSTDETNLSNAEAIACIAKSLEEIVEPFNLEVPKDVQAKDHQNRDATIINSFPNFSEHASEVSAKRKMMEIDSSIEIGMHDATTKAEKRMHTPDIQKEATAMMMDTSANALSDIAGSSSGTVGCNLSEETSTNLKPSPNPAEATVTETDMSIFELEDIASVCMTDPVIQKAEESFTKQELKMVADADITSWIDTPQELVATEFPLKINQEDPWLSDFGCTFGESSSELFNSTIEEARKPFMSNFLKSGISDLPGMPFPMFESMEMEHKSSSTKNFKRILDESTSMNKKIKEKTHPDFSGERGFNVASAISTSSACQSPGAAKKCVLPQLFKKGEELSNLQATQEMHEGRIKALVKEEINPISTFHAANEFGAKKSLKLLSCTTSAATVNLESLSMAQLRAMAKERNLKRYSKLNKSDMIKLLEESL